jgi:predicted site-specific integrase-resolvase
MRTAAIYARVSGDRQRDERTIESQTAALVAFAREHEYSVPDEWIITDDGFTGAELIRPGLERIRDLAAEGAIQAVLIYSPDRLCREYVHQALLIEEFARTGVEVVFVRSPRVARQSKQVTQRQSTIHPMVEQGLAGKLVSSPKPPEAGAQRARLYGSLTTRHHNCRMQLPLDEAHQRQ